MPNAGKGTTLNEGKAKHPTDQELTKEQTGIHPRDGREDARKRRENQKDMGVQPDHKTEEMEEKNRGTFP